MAKHKILRRRLNIIAKELRVFTTRQMVERLNSYPNNLGKRTNKSPTVCANQCHNFLRMDPEIIVKEKHKKNNSDTRNIWEYKEIEMADWGEEE